MAVENLITEHIDIWTSAIKTKSTSGRGSSKKLELYGVKKLRELILELAVRGKLVPQDPNDEPASVLLERIAAEKAELVKEKIIRKSKSLPVVSKKEQPFVLPKGWVWERLGNIGIGATGKTPSTKQSIFFEGSIPFIGPGQINQNGEILVPEKFLSCEGLLNSTEAIEGDILMVCIGGSIGKAAIARQTVGFNQQINAIRALQMPSAYLYTSLSTDSFLQELLKKATGSATPIINRRKWEELLVPIAPLEEQYRIVAKVNELMALCDQLEQQTEASIEAHQVLVTTLLDTLTNSADADELMQNWARISEHFDTLFTTEESIDQLKQTILQLAVMGKLVPQDPNDEPASELLKRIAGEKAQLVKEKKIKKQKALPPIAEDEKPFELPNGWVWERIDNLSNLIEYGSSQKTVDPFPGGVPVLKMGDIQNGQLILGDHKMMSADVEELPSLYLKNNDILYNRTNSAELVGKTGIFKGEDDKYSFASYLIRIRCNSRNVLPDYINLSMNTPLFRATQVEPHIKKQCGQANVNGTLMKSMLVSIPPLNEQKQIISKVNQLISACNSLRRTIEKSKLKQLNIANSIVKRLV
ncbi:TPA: restriction endonuclease subunit S [Vibrio parahaemolyticus]|uniref:restriction endonuclease subunit S n=2 Tax=Vibrio parahaemolyticus TaxID=670 RepID=UPI0013762909|nr:restriction endonuclease subunit S [Vibrio parahaemolyticus]MCF9124487.1 restriction endonuclease subunit S [Vibrio parahaemolyticus]NCM79076.1 restriction endonuclease subunit S [Vibrio parahaemolyticus]HCG7764513.1 restriction endonuclease subunit S [Vibrio parahaemolyticus]HDF7579350.1 restriction endonuclease subunit S [Vibrio parahaemolyticus]